MPTDRAEAPVAKRFFIALITRDITLEDAILDLVDNSVNSALRNLGFDSKRVGALIAGTTANSGKVDEIDINLNDRKFEIIDECGGIDIETARRGDLFGFGRDDEEDISGDILSVYGIGLKRAMFKLGQHIVVKSHHKNKAFEVEISVNEWAGRKNEWFFDLREIDPTKAGIQNGTSVTVTDLYPQIIEKSRLTLSNGDLEEKIAQTYSLFADSIVKIRLNRQAIPGTPVSVTDAAALLKNIRILEQRYLFLSKLSVGAQSHYIRSVASAVPAHTQSLGSAR